MVFVFCGLSFYLLSYKIYNTEAFSVKKFAVKRYFNLSLPIFAACLCVYYLNQIGAFTKFSDAMILSGGRDPSIDYASANNIMNVFYVPFLKCLFYSSTDFIFPLWSMSYIFIGGFITVIVTMILKESDLYVAPILALFIEVVFWDYFDIKYALIPGVCLLAFYKSKRDNMCVPAYMGGIASCWDFVQLYKFLWYKLFSN